MLLAGSNGVRIELTPLDWEFPAGAGSPDDEWLDVHGRVVRDGGGRVEWEFTDPCLSIHEARELGDWLRALGGGRLDTGAEVDFLEPVLGLAHGGWRDHEVVLHVLLGLEAAPPWRPDPGGEPTRIEVRLRPDALLDAAEEWRAQLDALPPRHGTAGGRPR